MPVVFPRVVIHCDDGAAALAFARHLTETEELSGVTCAGADVHVPGMTPAGAVEIAELAFERGHASDTNASRTIAGLSALTPAWADA